MITVYKSLSILIISLVYYVIVRYDYSVQITFHINKFLRSIPFRRNTVAKSFNKSKVLENILGTGVFILLNVGSSFLGFWLWGSKLGCGLLASILLKVKALYIHIKYKQLVISDSNSIITEYNNFRQIWKTPKAFW